MISSSTMKLSIGLTTCLFLVLVIITVGNRAAADASRHVPTIDELLTIKSIGGAQVSPDGKLVAYTVTNADFKQDAFVTQIWLVEVGSGRNIQLTRGEKSSGNPRWSPDGAWLAFTSNRIDDKNQIFVINPAGGEAIQLTKSETAIGNFGWSEDDRSVAYTATEPVPQVSKDRKDYLGDYEVVRKDYNYAHLWTLDVSEALKGPLVGKQRTKKKDFSVDSFSWSRDGSRIAFSATVNPDLIQGVTSDVYLLNLADDVVTKLVSQPGPDNNPRWSPDGTQIVFSSTMGDTIKIQSIKYQLLMSLIPQQPLPILETSPLGAQRPATSLRSRRSALVPASRQDACAPN